jgi:hypothetical protein
MHIWMAEFAIISNAILPAWTTHYKPQTRKQVTTQHYVILYNFNTNQILHLHATTNKTIYRLLVNTKFSKQYVDNEWSKMCTYMWIHGWTTIIQQRKSYSFNNCLFYIRILHNWAPSSDNAPYGSRRHDVVIGYQGWGIFSTPTTL